jgi:hypothetical protein
MSQQLPMLQPRILGRTALPVAPVVWRISDHAPADVLRALAEAGASWLVVDAGADDQLLDALARHLPGFPAVIAMQADQLTPRAALWLSRRLDRLSLQRAVGLLVQDATPGAIKAGGPFHRLIQLRERGLAQTFWLEAEDAATAEWMVENTPAHAVCLPFSISGQSAGYRVLPAAAAMGVALVARSGDTAADNLSFIAGTAAITSMLIDLPPTLDELGRIVRAVSSPTADARRQQIEQAYRAANPEPPRPRRNLPPDMA